MSQSKIGSIVEQVINISSGFVLAMIIFQFIVIPFWDLQIGVAENFWITCIYTTASLIRGYLWRRLFNWWDYHEGKEKTIAFFARIRDKFKTVLQVIDC